MAEPVCIRPVRPAEVPAVGELTAGVYVGDGFTSPDSPYMARLRDAAGRVAQTEVLVAADRGDDRLLGAVAFVPAGSDYAELIGPGEAEIRMLAVDPGARRRGVGALLVTACVERARATGCTTLRLSTQPEMTAAQRLYERIGFERTPDLDWSPVPDVFLLTYRLDLTPAYCDRCGEPVSGASHPECARARALEPPRWCALCRRRMMVQVLPTGWAARCSRHGAVTG